MLVCPLLVKWKIYLLLQIEDKDKMQLNWWKCVFNSPRSKTWGEQLAALKEQGTVICKPKEYKQEIKKKCLRFEILDINSMNCSRTISNEC